MDNSVIQQIKDSIAASSSIGIAAPKNPTVDEMAASLGLYLLLKTANKNVSIASPSDPLVEVSSLVGIDKVQKTLSSGGGTGDLTVSFPYTEGEIEKVSYTLEEGYLNIIVKAAEKGLSFDEKDVEYIRGGGKLDLVFVVGSAHLADQEKVFDIENLDTKIINLDNKPDNEQYGEILLVSEKLSSISEGVADLALSLGMHIDQDSAQNLLIGITDATKNFQDPRTSSLAFEMASLLLKKGATRESSVSARRGISVEDRPQQAHRVVQPQTQSQTSTPDLQTLQRDRRAQDDRKVEDNLQRRIQEERTREAQAANQAQPTRTSQIENKNKTDDEAPVDEETPTDWLAPKVYKGSSEV